MSIGFKDDGVIHRPIRTAVYNQLVNRTKVLNEPRNLAKLTSYASRTGWVKLSSGINIVVEENGEKRTTSRRAQENILFGGTFSDISGIRQGIDLGTGQPGLSSYNFTDQYGYRPMAGITSTKIVTLGTYGAITKATVEFTLHDIDQLNKIESLYLIPGYSMLLEWGHTIIVNPEFQTFSPLINTYQDFFIKKDNDTIKGELNRLYNLEKQKGDAADKETLFDLEIVLESIGKNPTAAYKQFKLDHLTRTQNYEYDALFAKVNNFSWTYNSGQYDCTVELTGRGEVTESLTALFTPLPKVKKGESSLQEDEDNEEVRKPNEFLNIFEVAIRYTNDDKSFFGTSEQYNQQILNFLDTLSIKDTPYAGSKSTVKYDNINSVIDGAYDQTFLTNWFPRYQNRAMILQKLGNFVLFPAMMKYDDTTIPCSYISMGRLLSIINKLFVPKDKNDQVVVFYEGVHSFRNELIREPDYEYKNRTPFTTFKQHVSNDLSVCFLPKSVVPPASDSIRSLPALYNPYVVDGDFGAEQVLYTNSQDENQIRKRIFDLKNINVGTTLYRKADFNFATESVDDKHQPVHGDKNDILNIQVNIALIYNVYNALYQSTSKSGNFLVWDFLRAILDKVQKALGNVNDFDFHQDKNIVYIVDRGLVPNKKQIPRQRVLQLAGKNSYAREVSFSSEISPEMSSAIAIMATGGGGEIREDTFAFNLFYKSFQDRFYSNLSNSGTVSEQDKKEDQDAFLNSLKLLKKYFSESVENRFLPTTNLMEREIASKNVFSAFIAKNTEEEQTNPPGIIPLVLNFTVDGIAGFRITDTFRVAPGLFPERYDDRIGFTIVGIDHEIVNNEWTTMVSAKMIILEDFQGVPILEVDLTDTPLKPDTDLDLNPDINEEGAPNATRVRNAMFESGGWWREKFIDIYRNQPKGFTGELSSSGRDITFDTSIFMRTLIEKFKSAQAKVDGTHWFRVASIWISAGNDQWHVDHPKFNNSSYHRIGQGIDFNFSPNGKALLPKKGVDRNNQPRVDITDEKYFEWEQSMLLIVADAADSVGKGKVYIEGFDVPQNKQFLEENKDKFGSKGQCNIRFLNEYRIITKNGTGDHFHITVL